MGAKKYIHFTILLFSISFKLFSQSLADNIVEIDSNLKKTLPFNKVVTIKKIDIEGNKKTKSYIILREAQLNLGDTLNLIELADVLQKARQNIYNTTLFYGVKIIATAIDTNNIALHFLVKERWYVYPSPVFKLVDRNFNEWSKTYNYDLRRIIYGLRFTHNNISGRRDQFKLGVVNGYTRGFDVAYVAPYSNSKLTEGFSVGMSYLTTREINYALSKRDSLLFFSTKEKNDRSINKFISKSFTLAANYLVRKGIYNSHTFGISYNNINVTDSIHLKYNPTYFNSNTSTVSFIDLTYSYNHIKVNNINYPLQGTIKYLGVVKRGFGLSGGINLFAISTAFTKFVSLKNDWYISNSTFGTIKLPFKQAYINQKALGYGALFLRGLELYAINAVAFAVNKFTIKKKVYSFDIRLPFKIPFLLKAREKIPFTFFAKSYADVGYAYNKYDASRLNNTFLYSGGFGFDVLSLYDINLRLEYSFNQLGEKGLFLRWQSGF